MWGVGVAGRICCSVLTLNLHAVVVAHPIPPPLPVPPSLTGSNRKEGDIVNFQLAQSILYKPAAKLASKNTGYIMVAVLSCW